MDRKELDRTFNEDVNKNQEVKDPAAKALYTVAVAIRGMWPEEGDFLKAGDIDDFFCSREDCKKITQHVLIKREFTGKAWKCTHCGIFTSLGVK